MIQELHLKHVGPAPAFDIDFAERLNILTGDNGLGKTFLLDVVWWVLTGMWTSEPALPQRRGKNGIPEILYQIPGRNQTEKGLSRFDFSKQYWHWYNVENVPGIFIYVQVNGNFAVSDITRNSRMNEETLQVSAPRLPAAFHFTPDMLWNGLEIAGKVLCKGLINDWVTWQYMPQHAMHEQAPIGIFSQILKHLSPHPNETITLGNPTRVSIDDVRDIPTIDLPYGNIPITYASAGMKRILGLAYLLVWAWYEHQQASFLLQQQPTNRLVLLVDEVESHLHPKWQRSILPALLDVATALNPQMQTQIITTTHSPLVLASIEPYFDEQCDKLFLFALDEERQANLREVNWSKHGDTVNWLVSDVFGLQQARSREAEQVIEAAEALMRGEEMSNYPAHLQTKDQLHTELLRLLPGHDPFFPRWVVTTQMGFE